MLLVAFDKLGAPNIVDNHVPNFFAAVLLGQKVLRHCCSSNFRKAFVVSDGQHLLFGQAA